jgi:hypothetical protein
MNIRIGATALVGLCLLSGCTTSGGYDGRDRDPANRPGYAMPGDAARAPARHTVRGPADAIRDGNATFEPVNGSDVVRAGNGLVRVAAGGGAGAVTVDGDKHSGVAGGTRWTPAGWESSVDRYDVDATAGVSAVTVERG